MYFVCDSQVCFEFCRLCCAPGRTFGGVVVFSVDVCLRNVQIEIWK